jgi:hypothetical protein
MATPLKALSDVELAAEMRKSAKGTLDDLQRKYGDPSIIDPEADEVLMEIFKMAFERIFWCECVTPQMKRGASEEELKAIRKKAVAQVVMRQDAQP